MSREWRFAFNYAGRETQGCGCGGRQSGIGARLVGVGVIPMIVGGLALVIVDFRTAASDLLPDIVGWSLVAVSIAAVLDGLALWALLTGIGRLAKSRDSARPPRPLPPSAQWRGRGPSGGGRACVTSAPTYRFMRFGLEVADATAAVQPGTELPIDVAVQQGERCLTRH